MDPHPQQSTDWNYTPAPATVTSKPTPAEWGWRARLRELSGGLIKLPPGQPELEHRTAVARIRATLPGSRTVVVANEKGGAGKTPTALVLSALIAEYRREAVVAWDVNELRGTLGRRAEITDPQLTVTDVLAAASELARPDAEVGLLSSYLRRQPEGNLVLASSEDGNAMRQIGHRECDIVRQLLLRRFGVVVCDTGNNAAAPNFLYTVDSADVLVLPTAPSDVHLEVARAMLRMLASRETTSHLVSRAVLVVTSSTGARLEPEEERWFADRIGKVVHVPADPVIAQGGKLVVSELSDASIRAWTLVAGAVIEAALAPSPHDKPRGRRRAPEDSNPNAAAGPADPHRSGRDPDPATGPAGLSSGPSADRDSPVAAGPKPIDRARAPTGAAVRRAADPGDAAAVGRLDSGHPAAAATRSELGRRVFSLLAGEPAPSRLTGHAQGAADAGPGDPPLAGPQHPLPQVRLDLLADRGHLGQVSQQLLVGHRFPRGSCGRSPTACRSSSRIVVAQGHTLVADVDPGAGDDLADFEFVLSAEGTSELLGRRFSHVTKILP